MTYRVAKILHDGLVAVESRVYGRQIWSRRFARGKKSRRCVDCGVNIQPKSPCWGEVTSCAMNRMERICDPCMEALTFPLTSALSIA